MINIRSFDFQREEKTIFKSRSDFCPIFRLESQLTKHSAVHVDVWEVNTDEDQTQFQKLQQNHTK